MPASRPASDRHRPALHGLAAAALAACTWCAPGPARAQETVIYRCTDARGNVTMQNDTPCPAGSRQEVRRIGTLPTAPAPAPAADVAPRTTAPPPGARFELVRGPVTDPLPAARVPDAERAPPPTLFQCETWDENRYLSDTATPEPRCVPLQMVGVDGSSALAGGSACEMKQDACSALDGAALCQAWRTRVEEARYRWTFSSPAQADARKAEYEQRAQALADSNCP